MKSVNVTASVVPADLPGYHLGLLRSEKTNRVLVRSSIICSTPEDALNTILRQAKTDYYVQYNVTNA